MESNQSFYTFFDNQSLHGCTTHFTPMGYRERVEIKTSKNASVLLNFKHKFPLYRFSADSPFATIAQP